MTARAQVELPELPCVFWRAINPAGGYMHFEYEPTHLADYEGLVLESDAQQAIAESEARAVAWEAFARHQVICADCAESVDFCATGRQLRDTATQAQEADREAGSA